MGTVAVIGASLAVQGFGLAGALVYPADSRRSVRDAWRTLPDSVTVVVLTHDAQAALGDLVNSRPGPLISVLP